MFEGRKSPAIIRIVQARQRASPSPQIRLTFLFAILCILVPGKISVFGQNFDNVTAGEAIFRSRWTGENVDAVPVEDAIIASEKKNPFDAEEWAGNVARTLQKILHGGPVDIRPSISTGWEYSDRSDDGQPVNSSNNNSFFAAPAARIQYFRQVGAWTVIASYSGAYKYYFNQNYTAGGNNSNRNPFNQTFRLGATVEGSRYKISAGANGSYGVGYDIDANQTVTRLRLKTTGEASYALFAFTEVGASGQYEVQIYEGENDFQESQITKAKAQTYVSQLVSTKTRLRFDIEAGEISQQIGEGTSDQADRNYVQAALSALYSPSGKLRLQLGGGARYVNDPNIENPKYVGLLPVYLIEAEYLPTEKLSLRGRFSLQGTDILPDYRLELAWRPKEETRLLLALYQNQNYSTNVVDQIQVNTGIIGTASQLLFRKIELRLSGGWQYVDNQSGSLEGSNSDYAFGFASAGMIWHIRDWVDWSTTWWYRSGRGTSNTEPENRVSVSLGLTF